MNIAVLKETLPGEKRVAIIPDSLKRLSKKGFTILVQSDAGLAAGFPDSEYEKFGATIESSEDKLFAEGNIIIKVTPPSLEEAAKLTERNTLISIVQPLTKHNLVNALVKTKATVYGLDIIPRTTLAQSMDVLSSMSTIVGYKSVIMAAEGTNKFFPMLMTAAGTIRPSKVLVLGAGVAGLMACATAKRLGAIVEATDVRPEVKDQVKSVGAKFLEVTSEESGSGEGGYAKEMSDEYKKKQAEMLAKHISKADVVIPTALIPGRKAPILITEDHVKSMKQGAIIIDIAAEMGGNCELTEKGNTVIKHGVTIIGNTNIASTMAQDASLMFSKNIEKFLFHISDENGFKEDMDDEIIAGSIVVKDGNIIHEQTKKIMATTGGN